MNLFVVIFSFSLPFPVLLSCWYARKLKLNNRVMRAYRMRDWRDYFLHHQSQKLYNFFECSLFFPYFAPFDYKWMLRCCVIVWKTYQINKWICCFVCMCVCMWRRLFFFSERRRKEKKRIINLMYCRSKSLI